MKLLKAVFVFTVCMALATSDTGKCCPLQKYEWCTDENIQKCYTCTPDDVTAIEKEKELFDKFMLKLDEYNRLKTTRFTVECKSEDYIVPVQVKAHEIKDKTESKYIVYEKIVDELKDCKDCTKYSTPVDYVNCVEPIRINMTVSIQGIIDYINDNLKKQVAKYRTGCNNILK